MEWWIKVIEKTVKSDQFKWNDYKEYCVEDGRRHGMWEVRKVVLLLYTAINEVGTIVKATFIITKKYLSYHIAKHIYKYLVKIWVLMNGTLCMPP